MGSRNIYVLEEQRSPWGKVKQPSQTRTGTAHSPQEAPAFLYMCPQSFTPPWAPPRATQIQVQQRALFLLRFASGTMGDNCQGGAAQVGLLCAYESVWYTGHLRRGHTLNLQAQFHIHPSQNKHPTSTPITSASTCQHSLPHAPFQEELSHLPTPRPRTQQASAGKTPMLR